ncbi:MAG: hypothetical protein AAF902_19570 [Chloroflexota bacterium]
MNEQQPNNFDQSLSNEDLEYLRHISLVLQQEGTNTFNLNELTPAWLTSDELHSSAHYWWKYYYTRIFGWIVGVIAAMIGATASAFVVGLLAMSAASGGDGIGFFIIIIAFIIAVILLIAGVIGYAASSLLTIILTGTDLGPFNPDPLTNRDHKAILWALKQKKLLPRRHRIWLRQMTDAGVIIESGGDEFGVAVME